MAKWGLFALEGVCIGVLFLYAYFVPLGPPPNSKAPGVALIDSITVIVMLASAALFIGEARQQENGGRLKWLRTPPYVVGIPSVVILSGPIFIGAILYR